jgi:hypothetical protein
VIYRYELSRSIHNPPYPWDRSGMQGHKETYSRLGNIWAVYRDRWPNYAFTWLEDCRLIMATSTSNGREYVCLWIEKEEC